MEFFERNVIKLPEFRSYSIGFVGSVAYFFNQILINTASYYGFEQIEILKNPIDGLEEYYKKVEKQRAEAGRPNETPRHS
jgi:hypothetical protein